MLSEFQIMRVLHFLKLCTLRVTVGLRCSILLFASHPVTSFRTWFAVLPPVIERLIYSTIAFCRHIWCGRGAKHCVTHQLRQTLSAIEIPKDAEGVWTFGTDSSFALHWWSGKRVTGLAIKRKRGSRRRSCSEWTCVDWS